MKYNNKIIKCSTYEFNVTTLETNNFFLAMYKNHANFLFDSIWSNKLLNQRDTLKLY